MTYDEVAAACNRNGHAMSKSHISQIVNGNRKPTFSTLEKIAQAIGVEIGDLIPARWEDTGETIQHTVVKAGGPSVTIKLYDLTVHAGRFCAGGEDVLEYITLPRSICPDPTACAVRVAGNSMVDAKIDDGDIVIVSPRHEPKNGESAVVCIDDEAIAIKLVNYPHGDDEHIILASANSDKKKYPDRLVKRTEVKRMLRVMHCFKTF